MQKLEKYFMEKVELSLSVYLVENVQRVGLIERRLIERRWMVALRHARGLMKPIP